MDLLCLLDYDAAAIVTQGATFQPVKKNISILVKHKALPGKIILRILVRYHSQKCALFWQRDRFTHFCQRSNACRFHHSPILDSSLVLSCPAAKRFLSFISVEMAFCERQSSYSVGRVTRTPKRRNTNSWSVSPLYANETTNASGALLKL